MKRFLNSLQGRLLIGLILVGIFPFAIVGYVLYNNQAQLIRSMATDELARLAYGAADELSVFVDNAKGDARAIAALPAIKSMDPANQLPVLQALRTQFTRYAQFGIADPDPQSGLLLLTEPKIEATSIAHVPSYQSAARGQQDAVIFPALKGDQLILHIHTPITDETGVVGVLGSPIPLPNLKQILQKHSTAEGNVLLIDQSGHAVVETNGDPSTSDVNYNELLQNLQNSAKSNGKELLTSHFSVDGIAYVAGVSKIPLYGWSVIVERTESEILAPLQRITNIAIVGMLFALLLILFAVMGLLRTLFRPLRTLVTASGALAAGDPSVKLPLTEDNQSEVDTLINSFERMRNAVTEREAAIRRQLSALEAASDGMAILNPQMHYTYANPAYMQMLDCRSESDVVGQSCRIFQPAEQVQDRMPEIMRTVQEKGVWRGELLGVDKNGRVFEQEASLTLLESGDFVCVARDISERKSVERAMQQSQRLESLGLLAGGIAHDFNNMLTAISSSAGLAQNKLPQDSPAHRHINVILKSTTRAANLTRQLLTYAGKDRTVIEELDPIHLLHDNLALVAPVVPLNAVLDADLPLSLPSITGDAAQIQQVVMNLLLNAIESLKDGQGTVRLTASVAHVTEGMIGNCLGGTELKPGKYLCIEVSDTGAGMSAQTLSRIFDPFFTTKSYGRGLGLSATMGILKSHHGAIQAESIPDHGSTFRIYLPANAHELPAQNIQPPSSDSDRPAASQTILVVDDEENILLAVRDILQYSGFSVLTAHNGNEGLQLFKEHHDEIALLLVDVQMPVMTGVEMVKQLKSLDGETPVIFCSGYNESDMLNKFGANVAYLQKPFQLRTLVAKIRQMLPQPQA